MTRLVVYGEYVQVDRLQRLRTILEDYPYAFNIMYSRTCRAVVDILLSVTADHAKHDVLIHIDCMC